MPRMERGTGGDKEKIRKSCISTRGRVQRIKNLGTEWGKLPLEGTSRGIVQGGGGFLRKGSREKKKQEGSGIWIRKKAGWVEHLFSGQEKRTYLEGGEKKS